jgi:hypothetical protein
VVYSRGSVTAQPGFDSRQEHRSSRLHPASYPVVAGGPTNSTHNRGYSSAVRGTFMMQCLIKHRHNFITCYSSSNILLYYTRGVQPFLAKGRKVIADWLAGRTCKNHSNRYIQPHLLLYHSYTFVITNVAAGRLE